MQRFRKILVGVDLASGDHLAASELNAPTREAIARGIWLAGHGNTELTFFAALDLSAHTLETLEAEDADAPPTVRDDAEAVLAEIVEQAKEQGVTATATLEFGKSWVEVIREVLRNEHDLVIVGTRDLSAPGRLLLGSTASKLLRNCPCPVWVTKPDEDLEETTMLVADDLTEVGDTALQLGIEAAQMSGAKVHVVHALEDPYSGPLSRTGLPADAIDEFRKKNREQAERALNEHLSMTDWRTLPFGVQTHVKDGPSDVVLLQAIEEFGIDLLVMGTVARSGIPGMLFGNTAERLLPEVSCSVLAIKPEGFVSPITLD